MATKATKPANSSSFATSVAPVSEQANNKAKFDHSQSNLESFIFCQTHCLFWNKNHFMEMCDAFQQRPNKEKNTVHQE